jgi:hypothetical protein
MSEKLESAESMGTRRLHAENQLFSALYLPDAPTWYNNRSELAAAQQSAMKTPDKLATQYLELLVRSHKLVEFIEHNFGNTDDWPMQVYAESDEAGDIFDKLVKSLRTSVGVLTEV